MRHHDPDSGSIADLAEMLSRLPCGDDLAKSFVRVVLDQPRFKEQLEQNKAEPRELRLVGTEED